MSREKMRNRIEEAVLDSGERMYRMAMALLRNEEEASGLVLRTAYHAVRNAGEVKNERYIESWLWKNIIYAAMDFLRENQTEIPLEALFAVHERGKEDDCKEAEKIWYTLGEREKAVIILYYFEGKRLEEAAVILNANVETVSMLLRRGMKKLNIEIIEAEFRDENSSLEGLKKNYKGVEIPEALRPGIERSIKQAKADMIGEEQKKKQVSVLNKMASVLQFFT
ncbi:MAG: sigma-70 family RNA polymerase sigma factor [Bacteroidales bacterium]|nr:sigma-70 family RNA polymerase sigma factor [Clostridium sp.]MCM1203674.1 sigma-70 family RNA polymerase sigma factor [Bacteroidales bacterium]